MKLTIGILFLFISVHVNAQQHDIPFPDSNAIWMMHTHIPPDPADPFQWSYDCHGQHFTHDTTHLNGYIYNNVYLSFSQFNYDFVFEDISNYLQIGRYRIEGQKVYYQNLIPQAFEIWDYCYTGYHGGNAEYDEFLMYDFGLSVGDTFYLTPSSPIVLESIDSVLIEGTYYRKFHFQSNSGYHWIEGIGSSIGLFPYFTFFEQFIYFNCFHEDNYDNLFEYYPYGNTCSSAYIPETGPVIQKKELINIVDVMGRKAEDKVGELLFFIYSDGTTEKIFRTD